MRAVLATQSGTWLRLRVTIRGAVQGVGFRPFVYRLATALGLRGWVNNSSQGVSIEVEGSRPLLEQFLLRLEREKPPRASIQSLESSFLDPVGYTAFEIRHSDEAGEKTALVLPDIATCLDCLREIFDPNNRRYLYPFTNCTNCGPRFSIIEALPYDRPNTTMKKFVMCAACQAEYHDPQDRRFHAQPNACPQCGPHLELWDETGKILATHHDALLAAAEAIREGRIVAVKGLGGFHLVVDARSEQAVVRLRQRKHREEKPLALMYPTMEAVREDCEVSELEERLLLSPESPIVLLQRNHASHITHHAIAPSVAPSNPYLGAMLPYTPLHHILLRELGFPIVATSGNLSDEPICTDEREALERLRGIADVLLVHDRPIVRHVDDSVARIMAGRELVMRRARGYAPLPVRLKRVDKDTPPLLSVGAHLKNTVALTVANNVFISQHIGDLETKEAFEAFRKVINSFRTLYNAEPQRIACDLHPDYLSSKFAKENGVPVVTVQHHYAHVVACMAENELEGQVLGVSWDGTGYGLDGTVWGGEFLLTTQESFQRIGHLRTFRLPGGEKAIKEPRRTALGVLYEVFGDEAFSMNDLPSVQAFSPSELNVLRQILAKGMNSPLTSSAGRLFDAVASLTGLRQRVNFEGQGAMELEFAIDVETDETYPFSFFPTDEKFQRMTTSNSQNAVSVDTFHPLEDVVDWQPMLCAILDDVRRGVSGGRISVRFHNTLAEIIVAMAQRVGEERVVLTGGCFQNKYLTERAVQRLRAEGFRPYWHQRVPPNDGGIALGQVVAAWHRKQG